MNSKQEKLKAIERVLDIMDTLREECPWDKKQTFESLRHLTIEETYELGEAILSGDRTQIKKELGDLLLHIVFYSKLGSEENAFDISDVANEISDKLIFRHPHIYGDIEVKDEEEVKKNWELLKLKEENKRVLSGVPNGLPSIVKAQRIQDKASSLGFDFEDIGQVWEKLNEEISEVKFAKKENNFKKIEGELGDLLFTVINLCRFFDVSAENALRKSNNKFIKRFQSLEKKVSNSNRTFKQVSQNELDGIWTEVKKE